MRLIEGLQDHRILAIVRGTDPTAALRTVLTLVEERLPVVEVSLTTPDALSVIARARRALGADALLGAGTVLSVEQATAAVDAGATFLVTPALVPELAGRIPEAVPVVFGALSPSEVAAALRLGGPAIKVFPASLGGPGYLQALLDPFPGASLLPVGGVDAAAAPAYLTAGAVAVGVGSPLVGDAASGGELAALRRRAAQFRDAVAGAGR